MKTTKSSKRFTKVATVLSAALLIVAATAAPALAEDQLVVESIILGPLQMAQTPVVGDGGAFEMVEPPAIVDGGAWEMGPSGPDPLIPDGGDWAPELDDDPQLPEGGEDDGAQEVTETPEPQEPQGDDEQPRTEEETETPEPDDEPRDEPDDEPYLPFTGGNGAPFALAGIALAVAGAGYLVRKRYVFDRD